MNLLMISGDKSLIKGEQGPFYYLLREFSKYWDRIDVICPVEGRNNFMFGNVHLHGVRNSVNQIFKKAGEIYQHSKFDLAIAHDYPPFRHSQAALKVHKRFKTPYMIEVHHVVGYPQAADFKEWLLKIYFEVFFKSVAKKAAAIRVVNQHQVPEFLKSLGVSDDKIVYLPSFYLDQEIFKPDQSEKKYDLLFVGRLAKNKGLDLLLEIFRLFKKEHPEFKAAMVGEGPGGGNLRSKIEDQGLTNNIELLGWLADSQSLAKVYNQSKILLITSYNEGGPRVGLEALACGLPVVSTKVGIMPDVIKDGENGYLADWSAEDFIEKIGACEHVSINKIDESVKQFDYHQMIKDYADGIKKITDNSRMNH